MPWCRPFTRPLAFALVTSLVAAASLAAPRYVFVTSASGTGILGGWTEATSGTSGAAAGDSICQNLASTAGLLNHTAFRAWLSTSTADAFCRVQGLVGTRETLCGGTSSSDPAFGPWVRMDGTPFAERLALMVGPNPTDPKPIVYRPIYYDEWGAPLPELGNDPWTGTSPYGESSPYTCSDWLSDSGTIRGSIGQSWHTGGSWTSFGATWCDNEFRLICLEMGPGDDLELPAESGALAFVTSVSGNGKLGDWADAGSATGRAAGNAICQERARAGHLPQPDSYVAWLSDSNTHAEIVITTDGPFSRIDGFALAATKNDLIGGLTTLHGTGLNVTELGTYYLEHSSAYFYIWTGTRYDGQGIGNYCNNWASNTSAYQGTLGSSSSIRETWTLSGLSNCNQVRPIYCFSNSVLLFWDNFERADTSRWSDVVPP